jgi:L-seryl-tRNA(Ser) seleniumtransferase
MNSELGDIEKTRPRSPLPSVDVLLRHDGARSLLETHGRSLVVQAIRTVLADLRRTMPSGAAPVLSEAEVLARVGQSLAAAGRRSLRRMFNLTGTVLHTNLGRAVLAEVAIEAAAEAMRNAVNLEFDVEEGRRGERDDHVAALLCRLTGAEAATVVNNNAAAVLLVLNALASGREAIVSRGELIEIGGAFRLPDIMARAGCRIREVGTTNRTHLRDYADAIGPDTGLLLKAHTSNYVVQGFVASVAGSELAKLAHDRGVPFAEDLGSGTLVDLERYGLPHEPTAREVIESGVDIVTFSGDKLLGGPQAGLIVGRKALIEQVNRNPMKRALRVDKMRLAAIEATLRLYLDPDRLAERLPTLRALTRPANAIAAVGQRLLQPVSEAVGDRFGATLQPCRSQIGSGALPLELMDSVALRMAPVSKRIGGGAIDALARAWRGLPVPVIGRIEDNALLFDLRCLDDEPGFVEQLKYLDPHFASAAQQRDPS